VYQWLLFAATELEPPVVDWWYREDNPDRAEAAVEPGRAAARVVQDALAGREYLVGGTFGLADIVCGDILAWARDTQLIDDMPTLQAYLARLEARPARIEAVAE
jgi:glutathione S-transferase